MQQDLYDKDLHAVININSISIMSTSNDADMSQLNDVTTMKTATFPNQCCNVSQQLNHNLAKKNYHTVLQMTQRKQHS